MFTMNKCSRAINCRIALNRKKYLNISLVQSEDFSFCIKFKFMNIFIFFFLKNFTGPQNFLRSTTVFFFNIIIISVSYDLSKFASKVVL